MKYNKNKKNNLLFILLMKKRIKEMYRNYQIKSSLLKLYEEKLGKLTEEFNEMLLAKYKCLNNNNNTFIR